MKWIGKALGGGLGLLAGGPLGAALGVLVGHQIDEQSAGAAAREASTDTTATAADIGARFFRTTFQVMGHVAKADGRVSEREIAAARETLMATLGRAPRDAEVAALLGIDVVTFWRWQADMERTVQVSLSGADGDREETGPSPIDFLRANDESPDEQMEQEEQVAALRDAILELKAQERTVLSLYYFEELNAREIAEVLGISESRVSQIRSKGLDHLRQIMSPFQASA